jgi:hypothetical protein
MVMFISHPAFAGKILGVGTATINNSGTTDASREVTLDLEATEFDNVNGMVFTLTFDETVFEYVGIVPNIKRISDSDQDTDPGVIGATIYYQANNPVKSVIDQTKAGRVLIAAAAANYFETEPTVYVPFKVKFRVLQFQGNGTYPIGIQKTVIGPATALNAGYTENVELDVAAGLEPDPLVPPTDAISYPDVALTAGSITVTGGYAISGSVFHDTVPANGVTVELFKKAGDTYSYVGKTTAQSGAYSFSGQPVGTYKIKVSSLVPGFEEHAEFNDITVDGNVTVPAIILRANKALTGKVKLNGNIIPGLKVKVVRKSDEAVIGIFNVDETGSFNTRPLPGDYADYEIYAVYGGEVSADTIADGVEFNFNELTLETLNISIAAMVPGQSVSIQVVQSDGLLQKFVQRVVTADPENITIENLISGNEKAYYVYVFGDGIPLTYYDGNAGQTIVFSERGTVDLSTTSTIAFTFGGSSYAISGKVTKGEDDGQSIEVFAVSEDLLTGYMTVSDFEGNYSFDVVPGKYFVYGVYKKTDSVAFYYKNESVSTTKYHERSILDVSSQNAELVNIILEEESDAFFYGTVKEKRSDGNPVPNLLITARNDERIRWSETNTVGMYKIAGFETDETATILIYQYPGSDQTDSASTDGTQVDFVVNQGYTINGIVAVKSTDVPVPNALVYLKDSNGKIAGLPVDSDATDGTFELVNVAHGLYTIIAVHPKYLQHSESLDASGDALLPTDDGYINILMESGASITGEITDDSAQLLEGVAVIAAADSKVYQSKTDASGVYTIEGLTDEKYYRVQASLKGYEQQFAASVKADDAGTSKPFVMPKIGITYTVSGIITATEAFTTATVDLYSPEKGTTVYTTTISGGYSFSDVLAADNYVLRVKIPGKPAVFETLNVVDANVEHNVNIASDIKITGIITLDGGAVAQTVYVYLVRGSEATILKTIEAVAGTTPGTYTYEFEVQSGVDYKIVSFCEGYRKTWYADAQTFDAASTRQGGSTADITLELQAD